MAHKTFISYKYSEAQVLRDNIIKKMGEDATYYKGERADSPDLTDNKTNTIKQHLKDMMYETTVTVVIISPNMKKSQWIDWEIEYCLRETERKGRTSKINGVVGVIMKVDGNYDWIKTTNTHSDGHQSVSYSTSKMYEIIVQNRFNQEPVVYANEKYKTVDELTGSYISLIEEDEFLNNPEKYIENAYEKSQNSAKGYNLTQEIS